VPPNGDRIMPLTVDFIELNKKYKAGSPPQMRIEIKPLFGEY